MLINSKVGCKVYLLDSPHLPLHPELEDCTVTMTEDHHTYAKSQVVAEAAKSATKSVGLSSSTVPVLKMKDGQILYLLHALED